MDRKAITERLRELASRDQARSKAARLLDVIEDVEAALAAGVGRASVVEVLAQHGLDMSLATFETTLKRIRQKRGKAQVTAATSAGHWSPPSRQADASHDPGDLDKIISSNPDLDALAKFARMKMK